MMMSLLLLIKQGVFRSPDQVRSAETKLAITVVTVFTYKKSRSETKPVTGSIDHHKKARCHPLKVEQQAQENPLSWSTVLSFLLNQNAFILSCALLTEVLLKPPFCPQLSQGAQDTIKVEDSR